MYSLTSLRRIFGVKNSTTNWAVLRECGQEPLQFFWFRASIRLFNSMLDDSNSETQVSNAFNGLQDSAMFKQKMLRATQVPMQEFICDLRFRHLKVWREANLSCPRAVNKKAVTYLRWCGSSESGPRGSPFSIPSYLYKDLDKHVLRNFSRFRLRAHHLRVESCKWHGGCDKCECGEV